MFAGTSQVSALILSLVLVGATQRMRHTAYATDYVRSCLLVHHVHYPVGGDLAEHIGVDGIDGNDYKVSYRLHSISSDTWGAWLTPTESTFSSVSNLVYGYKYHFSDVDSAQYDMVEWKMETSDWPGTNIDTQAPMTSHDFEHFSRINLDSSACGEDADNTQGFVVAYD